MIPALIIRNKLSTENKISVFEHVFKDLLRLALLTLLSMEQRSSNMSIKTGNNRSLCTCCQRSPRAPAAQLFRDSARCFKENAGSVQLPGQPELQDAAAANALVSAQKQLLSRLGMCDGERTCGFSPEIGTVCTLGFNFRSLM